MADTVTVEIEGLDELIGRLGKAPTLVRKLAGDAMEKSVAVVHRKLATYPSPPPASTYRRTGTLGRSITTKVERSKFTGEVGTNLRYAPYVIGAEQAAMHRGRWQTVTSVAEELKPQIEGFFREANEELARELAG